MILRSICRCGSTEGQIKNKNGQDCVYCEKCGRFQYNAPKTETGKTQRSIVTIHNGISSKKRASVISRGNGRCELCGVSAKKTVLHVSHIISVKDGFDNGLTEQELNDDKNLVALCEECNLGIGESTMLLRFHLKVIVKRKTLTLFSEESG